MYMGEAIKRVWQGNTVSIEELGLEEKMDFPELMDHPNVAVPAALIKRLGLIPSDPPLAEPRVHWPEPDAPQPGEEK